MADSWLIVLLKIAAMFLVILVGWVARRRAYLTAETTSTMSRFVVDLAIPALIFTQMLTSITPETVRTSWYIPLLGGAVLILGQLVGLALRPLFCGQDEKPTFVFLVAIANWIYLPLPIVDALFHQDGVRTVLLFNVGAQLILWTMGVWTLRGGKPDLASLKNLVTNPGLIATAAGIVLALAFPGLQTLEKAAGNTLAGIALFPAAIVQALSMVGSLTIPLSLVVTGAQLGGLDISDHRISRSLVGVLTARLLVVPVVAVAVVWTLAQAGWTIPQVPRMVGYIIAAMPVAVSCSIFTERFGGDTSLAARTIFISTLLSIATVPMLYYLIQHLGF